MSEMNQALERVTAACDVIVEAQDHVTAAKGPTVDTEALLCILSALTALKAKWRAQRDLWT